MWAMDDGWGWWMMWGGLMMVLSWGGIIGLIVWGVSRLGGRGYDAPRATPLDIARERLARGEITEEEFQRLKQHLT